MKTEDFKKKNPQITNLARLKSNDLVIIYDFITYGLYTVKKGDFLNDIAFRYEMYTYEIAVLNNISVTGQINAGQKIKFLNVNIIDNF